MSSQYGTVPYRSTVQLYGTRRAEISDATELAWRGDRWAALLGNGRRSCERMKSDCIYDFMCMNPRTVISDELVRFQTLYEGSWPLAIQLYEFSPSTVS